MMLVYDTLNSLLQVFQIVLHQALMC